MRTLLIGKVFFILILILASSAQIQITYEDALNWSGGKYLHYDQANDTIWPFYPPDTITIDTNMIWDFTGFEFQDTINCEFRSASQEEIDTIPGATHTEINTFNKIQETTATLPTQRLKVIEKLTSNSFNLIGTIYQKLDTTTNQVLLEEKKICSIEDTLFKFPLHYEQIINSQLEFDTLFKVNRPFFRYEWVKREVNGYGKIVLPGNDTLQTLGIRLSGKSIQTPNEVTYYLHCYLWVTKEYGITARANIYVYKSDSGNVLDTFILNPGVSMVFSYQDYSLTTFMLRIPDNIQGIKFNKNNGKTFYVFNKNNNRISEIDYAYNVKGQKILFSSLNRLGYVSNSIFVDKGFKTLKMK